jgi:opacity protein-like surface antigen
MKRFARVATLCVVGMLGVGSVSADAQTTSSGSDPRLYVELNGGPTLGHASDKFIGGEAGLRLVSGIYLFVEGSHIGNAATSDLDNRAAIIANYLGGTASTAFKINHVAAGVRYNVAVASFLHPYVMAGVGVANVTTDVTFSVNGSVVAPSDQRVQVGDQVVQLGGDLTGSARKAILVAGFGANIPFATRFFADIGYRYGRIAANTADVETDKAIVTQRVTFGVGVRF